MKNIFKIIVENPKSVMIMGIVLTSIFLISLLFPNYGQFQYDFEEGMVWPHENLVAPNDFFVWKTKTRLDEEKRLERAQFLPIYDRELDRSAFYDQYHGALLANFDKISDSVYKEIGDYLDQVSANDVIDQSQIERNGVDIKAIQVVDGDRLRTINPQNLLLLDEFEFQIQALLSVLGDGSIAQRTSLVYNPERTNSEMVAAVDKIVPYSKKVNKGDLIVARGSTISSDQFDMLQSLKIETEKGSWVNTAMFVGFLLLTCVIIGVFILYILFHYPDLYYSPKKLGFLLSLIVIMSFLVYSIERTDNLSSYLIPFCIVPIIVKSFFTDRLALFIHIVIVLIASFLSKLGYEFTFLQILAGIVAVLVIEDTRSWNKFFISILSIVGAYFIGYLGLDLIHYHETSSIHWETYKWLAINGVLTLLAYPFIPLLAKLFGFVSSITLAELNDLNRPLLKEMSINAPGTLQHSLQVANLCEAAAEEIGANSLLLKVGSLYHDIGKLTNPSLFIENQRDINPHDNMTNFESARAIISHVTEGVKMAKKHSLPQVLIDFISTHHGDTRVEYFYRNQLKQFPDKEFDHTLFNYPGPRPRSREETILMLADSLEAACKSLKNPTGKDIDELVDNIVSYKIDNDQLNETELSFADLNKCLGVFKQMLRSINHVRIEYPKMDEETNEASNGVDSKKSQEETSN